MLKVKPQGRAEFFPYALSMHRSSESGRTCVFLPAPPLYLLWGPELVTQSLWALISPSKKENNHPCFTAPTDVVRIKGDVGLRSMKGIKYNIGAYDYTPSSWGQERYTLPLPPTSLEAPSRQGSLYLLSLAPQCWVCGRGPVMVVEFIF